MLKYNTIANDFNDKIIKFFKSHDFRSVLVENKFENTFINYFENEFNHLFFDNELYLALKYN
jgi:hypothetical protein